MPDIHTPSTAVRPSGDISPLQLANAAKQPGGRFTSESGWLDQDIIEELADGTRTAYSLTEVNRMARELLYRRTTDKGAA